MRNSKPLDIQFNVAVNHMASQTCPRGWRTSDEAPETLAGLTCLAERDGILTVSDQHCEDNIFADVETNIAFRAWHDSIHYRRQFRFNLAGEAATAYVQIAQIITLYGSGQRSKEWAQLILCEVIGQAFYHKCVCSFPVGQRAFAMNDLPRWYIAARSVVDKIGEAKSNGMSAPELEDLSERMAHYDWGNPRG